MEYTPFIKGKSTKGFNITLETPVFQWEKTQDGTTYLRYEDTDDVQYMERISAGSSGKYEATTGLWSDKVNPSLNWHALPFWTP
jgi:hypothetical protein